ncbi:MAG TPA: hypothetical protein VGI39_28395 [Polyangiaceae bacterium]|jgi:hypothetical protein
MRTSSLFLRLSTFALVVAVAPRAGAAGPAPAAQPKPAKALPAPSASAGGSEGKDAPHAASTTPGDDEVVLKDGGMVRGVVTVLEPQKSVTILVQGSGESRTFSWDKVDHVARGIHAAAEKNEEPDDTEEEAPAPPPPPAPVRRSAPVFAPIDDDRPGMPRIHIEADDPHVQLRRYMGSIANPNATTTVSEILCRAPCDDVIDGTRGEEFFFAGTDITPSSRFSLFEARGNVTARVKTGDHAAWVGGLVSVITGSALAVGGGTMFAVGLSASSSTSNLASSQATNDASNMANTYKAAGGVAFGIGLFAAVVGLVVLTNNETTYEMSHPGTP